MTRSHNKRYRPAVTAKKALCTWLGTSIAATAAVTTVKFPSSWLELKATWPTLIVPILLAGLRAYRNWRKHNRSNPYISTHGTEL